MRSRSNRKRSIREYLGFVPLALAVICVAWLNGSSAATANGPTYQPNRSGAKKSLPQPRVSPTPNCNGCAAEGPQTIYAPLIQLRGSSGTEINLNCRSPRNVEVTPTFFTRNGEPFVGETFHMAPTEVKTVNLKTLMPPALRGRRDLGGMTLSYTGGMFEMWGQLRLMNVNRGNSVDVTFALSQDRRSAIRNAVWWMPDSGEATIAIGNFGNLTLRARATFIDGDTEEIEIPAFGTHLIERKSKSKGSAEGVTLETLGSNTDLIATGAVTSRDRSFTSSIRFYDTRNAAQPNLYATNFRLKDVQPRLVLRNTGSQIISVTPRFIPAPGDPNNFIDLPTLSLDPDEVSDVNIEPLRAATLGKTEFDHVSIQILNNGAPGSLIGALNGTNAANNMTYDVPLRDIGALRNSTGAYPWRIDQDLSTIVSLTNTGTVSSGVVVQLNYPGGTYLLDPRPLAAGETVFHDLREIRDKQIPDRNGRTLPRSVKGGQFKWFIYGFGPGSGRVIGRAEMISESQGISSSYSCPGGNCPPEFSYVFFDNPEPFMVPGNTAHVEAYEIWCDAYGCYGPIGANVTSWDNSHPLTATLIDSGAEADLVAIDGGSTTFSVNIGYDRYGWDGLNCYWLGWFIGGGQGTAHVMEMDSISPNKGVVSATTEVLITGTSFFADTASLVIEGTGVTASNVNVVSDSTITADIIVASNATPGNHLVRVRMNGLNSNGKNFFVQVPSKLVPFNHQLAPNGVGPLQTPVNQNVTFLGGQLAIQNFCGVYRSYLYILADQQGDKIQAAFTFDEIFTNVTTPQTLAAPAYIPVNFPANYVAIEDLMSVGFQGGCLNTNEFQVFDQQFKITIGGTAYFPSTKLNFRRGNEAGTLKVDRTITTP